MAARTDYSAGLATLAAGGTTVTFTGGANITAADIQPGDTFKVQNLDAIIATVTDDTHVELTAPWTGTALAAATYRIRYQPDGSRYTAALRNLVDDLSDGNVYALSTLTGSFGKIPRFTGAGAMDLIDEDDFTGRIQLESEIATKETSLKFGDDPLVVIAAGQSDMAAVSTPNSGDRSTEPGVFVWEQFPGSGQTTGWKEAGPDEPDWPFISGGVSNGGIAYSFCRTLRRATKRKVYLIMHAAGGQPISAFKPGGTMWAGLIASIRDAAGSPELAFRATVPLADYFLFSQGQADADYTGGTDASWTADFETFISAMRSQHPTSANVWPMRAETPVLVCELLRGAMSGGNVADSRNSAIRQYAIGRDRYIINVSTHNYRSLDNLHIIARDLEDLGGRRCYEAAMSLPKPSPVEASTSNVSLGGRVVSLRSPSSVTVNAGATVPVTLPVTMANSSYVPTLTLFAQGASTYNLIVVESRTPTGFNIRNGGAANAIVGWSIVDLKAA